MTKFAVLVGAILLCSVSLAYAAPDSARVVGDFRISGAGSGLVFPDGSVQYKATAQGPDGIQGPQGPPGPAGAQGLPGPQGAAGAMTLASACSAISSANIPLPSFCTYSNSSPNPYYPVSVGLKWVYLVSPPSPAVPYTVVVTVIQATTNGYSLLYSYSNTANANTYNFIYDNNAIKMSSYNTGTDIFSYSPPELYLCSGTSANTNESTTSTRTQISGTTSVEVKSIGSSSRHVGESNIFLKSSLPAMRYAMQIMLSGFR
jgi:hypothetical protein